MPFLRYKNIHIITGVVKSFFTLSTVPRLGRIHLLSRSVSVSLSASSFFLKQKSYSIPIGTPKSIPDTSSRYRYCYLFRFSPPGTDDPEPNFFDTDSDTGPDRFKLLKVYNVESLIKSTSKNLVKELASFPELPDSASTDRTGHRTGFVLFPKLIDDF